MKHDTAVAIANGLGLLILIAGLLALVTGVWWLLWLLWCFVLPQVWPTGPEGLIRPGYWLFAGMWTLFVLVVRVIKRKV